MVTAEDKISEDIVHTGVTILNSDSEAETERRLAELGEKLAEALDLNIDGRAVRVVSGPEDMDVFTAAFFEELRLQGADVSLSCFWTSKRQLGGGILAETPVALLDAQYNEPVDRKIDLVITLALSIDDGVVAAANHARAIEMLNPAHALMATPLAGLDEVTKLRDEFLAFSEDRLDLRCGAGPRLDLGVLSHAVADKALGLHGGRDLSLLVPELVRSRPALPESSIAYRFK